MCAIIGVAGANPVAETGWLASGRDAMRHRGPDDAGEWWSADRRVGLGHRRLAVLDLSPAGRQPMCSASGEVHVVFNGEIYNFADLRAVLAAHGHVFRTRTDTEVILAAYLEWGDDCLERLNGMFALALYDARRRRLLLARDRAGEKPLFYTQRGAELRFASELKGLLADPALERRMDFAALDGLLLHGFVPGDQCLLQGMRKLAPGHALSFEVEAGAARVWRYWSLPDLDPAAGAVEETALVDEAESLLEAAVRRQLVADVPIGVLLSGGVDSSLVTALAARAAPRVRTFSIRFPGYGRFDETEHARLIARHFATDHVELVTGESSVELLPRLARQFDEPVTDSSMVPTYLVCEAVRRHCTVALGGDGGDELFGGYPHHSGVVRMDRMLRRVPLPLRQAVGAATRALLPLGFRGRRWLQNADFDFDRGLPPLVTFCFDRQSRRGLLAGGRQLPLDAEARRELHLATGADLLQRVTRQDFRDYLAEDILVKLDRTSMHSSLEIRAPFLDRSLIEFAFRRVPSALKASASDRKILLKKLTSRLLPAQFDRKRKQGFSLPLDSWLRAGPWRRFFDEVLLGAGAQPLFDRGVSRRLLGGQGLGLRSGERLFSMVLIELWRREYRVTL